LDKERIRTSTLCTCVSELKDKFTPPRPSGIMITFPFK
jgi:hypothetical protein